MSGYRLRPRAVQDLAAIGDFIATDNPTRAVSFVREIRGVCWRLAQRPKSYRRRDDLASGLRQVVHGRYLMLFTVDGDGGVMIERIVHGARRLEDLV